MSKGATPLHWAAAYANKEAVVELANGKLCAIRDKAGYTPLMHAVQRRALEICAHLLPLSDMRQVNWVGEDVVAVAKKYKAQAFLDFLDNMTTAKIEQGQLDVALKAERKRGKRGLLRDQGYNWENWAMSKIKKQDLDFKLFKENARILSGARLALACALAAKKG